MKTIKTLILVMLIGMLTNSDTFSNDLNGNVITSGIELKADKNQEEKVARLYIFKNSRVKKALKFKTKRNASKII